MALVQQNLTVGTSATLLTTLPSGSPFTAVTICNNHNQPIYLGKSNVATSGATVGVALAAGASTTVWLNANDSIYAISAALATAGAIVVLYSGF